MSLAAALTAQAATVIDDASLTNEADGTNWAAFGRTFSEQRYSPPDQIDKQNVGRLGLAWSLELDDVWNVTSASAPVTSPRSGRSSARSGATSC